MSRVHRGVTRVRVSPSDSYTPVDVFTKRQFRKDHRDDARRGRLCIMPVNFIYALVTIAIKFAVVRCISRVQNRRIIREPIYRAARTFAGHISRREIGETRSSFN